MKQIISKHVTTKQRHNKKVKILQGSDPKAQSLKLKLDKRIEMRIDRGDTDPLPHDTIAAIDRGDTDPLPHDTVAAIDRGDTNPLPHDTVAVKALCSP
jgi:hypothetical protein